MIINSSRLHKFEILIVDLEINRKFINYKTNQFCLLKKILLSQFSNVPYTKITEETEQYFVKTLVLEAQLFPSTKRDTTLHDARYFCIFK